QSASVRPLRHYDVCDLRPRHRVVGPCRQDQGRAAAPTDRRRQALEDSGECKAARKLGYTAIKLHETTVPAVAAAREAIGPGVPLLVDMNCPLSGSEAIAFAHACRDAAPMFLEEPVWPPEDFATLAEVR